MSNLRVWHPSRDPYHCAFRIIRLLAATDAPIQLERLRILDMFILFPSLLHRTSMPEEVRAKFRDLSIPKLDKLYIRLPSLAAIFQDLRIYQNSALGQLAARGIISPAGIRNGFATLSAFEASKPVLERAKMKNISDDGLSGFLIGPFSTIPLRGAASIYRKAGLPIRAIAA